MALGDVEISIDAEDVVDQLNLSELIDYFGVKDILDEIGQEEAIEHFGIKVAE